MSVPFPIDPDDFPGSGVDSPPSQLPGLGRFLRRRYTCNIAIMEQMSANDLLHEVIFVSSRHYFTQAANGQISLKNKKPSPWALGMSVVAIGDDAIDVDSVTDWIGNVDNFLLIAPHTTRSEIRRVTAANYGTAQNSIGLSSTGGLFTISGFAGCDGADTPATASITVTAHTADTDCSITLDGTVFAFRTSASDTNESIASFIAGMIASHPQLYRRFTVDWTSGAAVVNLTARIGTLTLEDPLTFAQDAPLVDPVTAPTLAAAGSGSLAAGVYAVAYSAVNAEGETLLSQYKSVTLTANQKINVSTVSLPAGATALRWYCSPQENSAKLRYLAENDGTGFSIDALPLLSAPLPPDLNRTGVEVMRLAFVFSDREEERSATSRANVLKGTFSWLLGNRESTVNRIDLKYRDASQDWRLVELRLRDDAHIAKTKKVSNKEINGQAIDNTDQAYRITSGMLAEKRDSDFFYKWEGTREALLLQEGDVGAITDRGSGVYNFPVILEDIEFDIDHASLPKANFTARKYSSTLYDDSVVDRTIPIVIES
jgi:hypothetical protein